jgi:dehydro coenzyme F420 reductase / coenzyme F420-0:L-glutamate ligase / coenzyme F420-1:gamma-L-glutamate ligase
VSLVVLPLGGLPEFRPGDDLAELLTPALLAADARDGDVVVVTSKIVSKAEGRLVAGDDRAAAVAQETRRVVARRGDLVIAETRHGFVCANAGVDASNLAAGTIALLPTDPDASATGLREALRERLGRDLAVVVTDTFGRAWRTGLVNVAIGCAGLPAVVDLRGTPDHHGQTLEATIVALADEVAAASGLVMQKAARIPAAVVRGVDRGGATDTPASSLLRPADEDLFRTSPLQAIFARRSAAAFASSSVPRETLEMAVTAAFAAATPGGRPWRFDVAISETARAELRISVPALPAAPVYLVPSSATARIDDAMRLGAGAAIQSLMLALDAQAVAAAWVGPNGGTPPFGVVAAGPAVDGAVRPRPPIDPNEVTTFR